MNLCSVRESDSGLIIVEQARPVPARKPKAENVLLDTGRAMFSLDGRRMIAHAHGALTGLQGCMVPCYSVRTSSFDGMGRLYAEWRSLGSAYDLPVALRFLAGEDVELYT